MKLQINEYSPWDDTIVNEAQHRHLNRLKRIHLVDSKLRVLPYHQHTNHHAYAHVLDAMNQKDGYADLFH